MSADAFYRDYWSEFFALVTTYPIGLPSASDRGYYRRLPKSGFGFQRSAVVVPSKGLIAVEFICETATAGEALKRLQELRVATPEALLKTYPGEIEWYGAPEQKIAKAWEVMPARLDDRTDWPAQHLWMASRLLLLETIFGPIARRLGAAAP